jgi:hypothetical protein
MRDFLAYLCLFIGLLSCETSIHRDTVLPIRKSELARCGASVANIKSSSSSIIQYSEDCLLSSNYICEVRKYSPKVDNSTSSSKECFDSKEVGKLCVKVTRRNFDTANAASDPHTSASDLEEGGMLNYSEANCIYLPSHAKGDAESLSTAFDFAYRACLGKKGGE